MFLECIDPNEKLKSGASEYEIYFNYLLLYHKNEFEIRNLKWINTKNFFYYNQFDYISCHWYLQFYE